MRVVDAAALTSVGPVRTENQDRVAFTNFVSVGSMQTPAIIPCDARSGFVAAVDGMGGHSGGRTAAGIVARHFAEAGLMLTDSAAIRHRTHEAARDLHMTASNDPSLLGMGATIAGVAWQDDFIQIFHVGDSRVYGAFGDVFRRLTDDHRVSDDSNVLSKSIGGTVELELPDPAVQSLKVQSAVRLVCCTDGLSDSIPFAALSDITRRRDSPAATALALVQESWAAADDNITVLVVDLLPDDAEPDKLRSGDEDETASAMGTPMPADASTEDVSRRFMSRIRESRK